MNKTYLLIAVLFLSSYSMTSLAQTDDVNYEDRIETNLEYLIEQLDLKDNQREQFKELYREHKYQKFEERKLDRVNGRKDRRNAEMEKFDSMTEEEAQEMLIKEMEDRELALKSKKEYNFKLMRAIGAKNTLKLQILEKELHRKWNSAKNRDDNYSRDEDVDSRDDRGYKDYNNRRKNNSDDGER